MSVDPTGLEPATSPVQGERSSQMSYGPVSCNKQVKIIVHVLFMCASVFNFMSVLSFYEPIL